MIALVPALAPPHDPPAAQPDAAVVLDLARYLVDAGRVVPGLVVDGDGRGRSCWWPLPAASDRDMLAALVTAASEAAHQAAASALADAVDRLMRERIAAAGVELIERRSGRRSVVQAWLIALTARDAALPAALDPARVSALADEIAGWVRSGAALLGRTRLVIRVHDAGDDDTWPVETLLQAADESSLLVPVSEALDDPALFGEGALEEALAALGHLVRVAPELVSLLDDAAPSAIRLDAATFLRFVTLRVAALGELGIAVLLPAAWTARAKLGLRAKARSPASPGGGGIDLGDLVSFTWEAALGGRRLTRADLRVLERAAAAKQPLVRLRGEWVEVDPQAVAALVAQAGTAGEATVAELVRAGLGVADATLAAGVPVLGVDATGWLGTLLDDAMHSSISPMSTPERFDGTLRPYQERGVGWLVVPRPARPRRVPRRRHGTRQDRPADRDAPRRPGRRARRSWSAPSRCSATGSASSSGSRRTCACSPTTAPTATGRATRRSRTGRPSTTWCSRPTRSSRATSMRWPGSAGAGSSSTRPSR